MTAFLYPFRWKMNNIWFPLPVALFIRRAVNVLSTLSITHHYLFPLPPQSTGADTGKNAKDHSFLSSPWPGRIPQSPNRPRQQEAERHVLPCVTIAENNLIDILQGTRILPKLPLDLGLSLTFLSLCG